jgi:uncharacterized protein (DUF1015 family)
MEISAFQAIYPKTDLITSPESFFGSMKYQFKEFYNSGFFDKSSEDALYLYKIENHAEGIEYIGILCFTAVNDLLQNKILKHEKTLAAKEQQMMRLILQREAHIKPVLLTYKDVPALNAYIDTYVSEKTQAFTLKFEKPLEFHKIWRITEEEDINTIKQLFFDNVHKSYIADGHHRCSTTEILYNSKELVDAQTKFGKIFTIYFPLSQLRIWDFNRVVEVFDNIDIATFLVRLSKYCKIKKLKSARKPKSKFEITMHLSYGWFSLKWKKKIIQQNHPEKVLLDCQLFNRYILKEIINVEDIREDQRITYFSGKEGTDILEEQVRKGPSKVAFCIFPVLKEELITKAEALETLPPKSTFFEPRMKNGVISSEF